MQYDERYNAKNLRRKISQDAFALLKRLGITTRRAYMHGVGDDMRLVTETDAGMFEFEWREERRPYPNNAPCTVWRVYADNGLCTGWAPVNEAHGEYTRWHFDRELAYINRNWQKQEDGTWRRKS